MLNDTGFCDIWIRKYISESTWLYVNEKQSLLDQYTQKWVSNADTGVKC